MVDQSDLTRPGATEPLTEIENEPDEFSRRISVRAAKAALRQIFTVDSSRSIHRYNADYVSMYCSPKPPTAEALLIDRQVLALIVNYKRVHARTIALVSELIAAEQPQLYPYCAIVIHGDPEGDQKLRNWGRAKHIAILPIYRPLGGRFPAPPDIIRSLSRELFQSDPFQVTGPVSEDVDFFGRRDEALEVMRSLQVGRVRGLFGLRKSGKTSLINRVVAVSRQSGSPSIGMIDCSAQKFSSLSASDALRVIAAVALRASISGYADLMDVEEPDGSLRRGSWTEVRARKADQPLALVLDEIHYITPQSPNAPHWNEDFNNFWREFRVIIQESQRRGDPLALLVSGSSSRSFRGSEINGVENAAVRLVPEEYLAPFPPRLGEAMLDALGRRCGLELEQGATRAIAASCGNMPFWIRMAGSYLHKSYDIDRRPYLVTAQQARLLMEQFIRLEGVALAREAIEDLARVDEAAFAGLLSHASGSPIPSGDSRLLQQYGLLRIVDDKEKISAELVDGALAALKTENWKPAEREDEAMNSSSGVRLLSDEEWKRELAALDERFVLLERRMREMIRFMLRAGLPKSERWHSRVLQALSSPRRVALSGKGADALMPNLLFLELRAIINKEWALFESVLGDKVAFQQHMEKLNGRPFAHAKDIDLIYAQSYRDSLKWMEERVLS